MGPRDELRGGDWAKSGEADALIARCSYNLTIEEPAGMPALFIGA
jgi:hypothetical protein